MSNKYECMLSSRLYWKKRNCYSSSIVRRDWARGCFISAKLMEFVRRAFFPHLLRVFFCQLFINATEICWQVFRIDVNLRLNIPAHCNIILSAIVVLIFKNTQWKTIIWTFSKGLIDLKPSVKRLGCYLSASGTKNDNLCGIFSFLKLRKEILGITEFFFPLKTFFHSYTVSYN